MRLIYADTATPAHAVEVGDRLRERRTGEVREVREIAATLTERRMILDDGTHIDCMFLDTVFVTTDQVTESTGPECMCVTDLDGAVIDESKCAAHGSNDRGRDG